MTAPSSSAEGGLSGIVVAIDDHDQGPSPTMWQRRVGGRRAGGQAAQPLPDGHLALATAWVAAAYLRAMTTNAIPMTEILLGALQAPIDPDVAVGQLIATGVPAADIVVLRDAADLDEVRHGGPAHGLRSRLRHVLATLDRLDESGAGHVLQSTETDLAAGRTVLLVRHVDATNAPAINGLLQAAGISHTHYLGRWTVLEHGHVPAG